MEQKIIKVVDEFECPFVLRVPPKLRKCQLKPLVGKCSFDKRCPLRKHGEIIVRLYEVPF